jgi:hypothetical protein
MNSARRLLPIFALGFVACGNGGALGGKGSVQVFVVPEDSIASGVKAGTTSETIQDGWTVDYSKFLVTIGGFRARSTSLGESVSDPTVFVLDLKNAPPGGYVTAQFTDLTAGRWDRVGEDLPVATGAARPLPPTTADEARFMTDHGYSIYFEGTLSKPDGVSCNPAKPAVCKPAPLVKFRWGFAIGTSFDDCASAQGDTGFAVPAGGSTQLKPTIHGDHWFFSDLTQGAEVTRRYAQYIADSDLDGDGETTLDELKSVKSSDVFPSPKYRLSGTVANAPIRTAFDYVQAQARTLHKFQGDGECPTRGVLK